MKGIEIRLDFAIMYLLIEISLTRRFHIHTCLQIQQKYFFFSTPITNVYDYKLYFISRNTNP